MKQYVGIRCHMAKMKWSGATNCAMEWAERCVKVDQSGTTDERERNANRPSYMNAS